MQSGQKRKVCLCLLLLSYLQLYPSYQMQHCFHVLRIICTSKKRSLLCVKHSFWFHLHGQIVSILRSIQHMVSSFKFVFHPIKLYFKCICVIGTPESTKKGCIRYCYQQMGFCLYSWCARQTSVWGFKRSNFQIPFHTLHTHSC